jgi:hypothetical protein
MLICTQIDLYDNNLNNFPSFLPKMKAVACLFRYLISFEYIKRDRGAGIQMDTELLRPTCIFAIYLRHFALQLFTTLPFTPTTERDNPENLNLLAIYISLLR